MFRKRCPVTTQSHTLFLPSSHPASIMLDLAIAIGAVPAAIECATRSSCPDSGGQVRAVRVWYWLITRSLLELYLARDGEPSPPRHRSMRELEDEVVVPEPATAEMMLALPEHCRKKVDNRDGGDDRSMGCESLPLPYRKMSNLALLLSQLRTCKITRPTAYVLLETDSARMGVKRTVRTSRPDPQRKCAITFLSNSLATRRRAGGQNREDQVEPFTSTMSVFGTKRIRLSEML